MNTSPSALSSYGPAGFVLIILQWYLVTRFHVTMPDDVALAAAGLLGHIVDTLRQTPRVQAWFAAPAAPQIETVHYSDGSSATGPAPLPRLSPEQQGAPAKVDAWRPPAPSAAPEQFTPAPSALPGT